MFMSNNNLEKLEQELRQLKKTNSSLTERVEHLSNTGDEDGSLSQHTASHKQTTEEKTGKKNSCIKGEYLATISHEINTPMNGVMGMLELLLNTPINDKQRHMVKTAHTSAASLLTVINDILDFSKIKSGQLNLQEGAFDLRQLLDDVIDQLSDSAHTKNLELVTQLPENIKYEAIGDSVRLRQVIANFLSNAIKFTEHGKIKFITDVEIIDKTMHVNVTVQDTGKGIDPANQAIIFEPFEQEDGPSTSRSFDGTGLGLSIARDLVKLMGGEITLQSTPGEGSTFHFSVQFGVGEKLGITHESENIRILLAEDNPVNQEIMSEQMEMLGYEIEIVDNGLQALEAVKKNIYTLIFMDVHMPDMDGLAATEAIRSFEKEQNRQAVPVIALTADVSQNVQEKCKTAGMNTYLAKPFSIDDIENTLKSWLGDTRIAKLQTVKTYKQPTLNTSEDLNMAVIEQLRALGESGGRDSLGNAVNLLDLAYNVLFTLQNTRSANTLWHQQQLLEAAEHTAQVSHWTWIINKQHLQFSTHLQDYFNHSLSDIKTLDEFIATVGDHHMEVAINSCLANGQESNWEQEIVHSNSEQPRYLLHRFRIVTSEDNNPMLIGTVQEISSIRRAEQRVMELAFYDSLTKLSSRSSFNNQLQDLIISAHRKSGKFAVLHLDLDEFKNVNDSFGHDAGDKLLIEVANRLRNVLRESDFASRLGGDEFCLLINNIEDNFSAAKVAQRCLELLAEPFTLAGREFTSHASIGIAIYPHDGHDANVLIKAADTAMNEAKKTGKKQYAFYEAAMTDAAQHRLTIENDLVTALSDTQFELYYQPKISLSTGKTHSVEALIRWNHPDNTLRSPDTFIPDAERLGLISKLGEWVVQEACAQIKTWKSQGLSDIAIAVNISPKHFEEPDFSKEIAKIVNDSGVSPALIEIEITESSSRNHKVFLNTCQELRKLGFTTAIDDFGTGYSSLSVLKGVSVDVLKIDREFIRHLPNDSQSTILIGTILGMSKALGLEVVAEGVETEEQLKLLVAMGCHMAQGYYFSKPVPAAEIPALIKCCFRRPKNNQVA